MQAVIFDMDGVLVDSEPLHTIALQNILAAEGFDYPSDEVIQDGLGRSFASHIGELIPRMGLPGTAEHYASRFQDQALRLLTESAGPSPGASALLDDLKRRGYKLGLASSSAKDIVWGTLRILGFDDRFDVVVSGDLVASSKPDPEIFLLAAERLGVDPKNCVVVEDSPRGIEGAKRAGMLVVAVRTDLAPLSEIALADHIVSTLTDFPHHVLA